MKSGSCLRVRAGQPSAGPAAAGSGRAAQRGRRTAFRCTCPCTARRPEARPAAPKPQRHRHGPHGRRPDRPDTRSAPAPMHRFDRIHGIRCLQCVHDVWQCVHSTRISYRCPCRGRNRFVSLDRLSDQGPGAGEGGRLGIGRGSPQGLRAKTGRPVGAGALGHASRRSGAIGRQRPIPAGPYGSRNRHRQSSHAAQWTPPKRPGLPQQPRTDPSDKSGPCRWRRSFLRQRVAETSP